MEAGASSAKGETTAEPLTRAQAQVARRVAESRATVPAFSVELEVDVSGVGAGLVGPAVVAAAGQALAEHPRANASYRGDAVELFSRVNAGVVVDTADAPVSVTVFDCSSKEAAAVAEEIGALAAAAHDGTITPPQVRGATFSVTDLSLSTVRSVEPVVLPGQVVAFSVGGVSEGASGRRCVVALACDARVLSAGAAAAALERVRGLVEGG